MQLKVLGSSSCGNCYLLESETECLVIETGISFMEVKKAIDFNIKKIVGVVCSHIHGDHSKYATDYEKAGIPVFKPYEKMQQVIHFGDFTIKPFELVHDVDCYGFFIKQSEIGKMVYITDTEFCKYKFKELNNIVVEANYSKDTLNMDLPNIDHVLQGHFSLEHALDFIKVNDNAALKNVILCHLSPQNADTDVFLQRAKETTDKLVFIAKKGLTVDMNIVPF